MPSSFGGYLANISPSEYRELYEAELPAALAGADFLRTYGPHLDTATAVDPGMVYAVKDPTVHPIHENHRWGMKQRREWRERAPPGSCHHGAACMRLLRVQVCCSQGLAVTPAHVW